MRYTWFFALFMVFAACEKDPDISGSEGINDNLEAYSNSFSQDHVSANFLVFAGNHRSFERETEDEELHLYVSAPEDAADFRFFLNDSVDYPDSSRLYTTREVTQDRAYQQFLARFSLPMPQREKLVRVSYVSKDSLFLSDPIYLPGKNDTTKTFETLTVEQELPGRATFRWNDGPGLNDFFLMLSDRSGDVFCAITTTRDRFRFYDLRDVDRNLSPDLFDPRLAQGQEYQCTVFGISSQGWAHRYGTFIFIHE